jgi:transcription elongation GreA/GreB family factor
VLFEYAPAVGDWRSDVSRAFVKEDDQSKASAELPERPQSPHPNYVTPKGLADLERCFETLTAERSALSHEDSALTQEATQSRIDRDLRYLAARIETAIPVDPALQPRGEVAFGATVRVFGPEGRERVFTIVGEDEADVATGKVSWVSPLARALLGASVDDTVTWKRPSGDADLEIASIDYEPPANPT